MPTNRKNKYLKCIPKDILKILELEEKKFISEALQVRQALLQKLFVLLENQENLNIKQVSEAIKILQEQIHLSIKDYQTIQESSRNQKEEDFDIDIDPSIEDLDELNLN